MMPAEHEHSRHGMHGHEHGRAAPGGARPHGPGFASPQQAMQAPREEFCYVSCMYRGTGIDAPDHLAVVDLHPDSDRYGQVIHRTVMPYVGDELHNFGWQACSGASDCVDCVREHLIVPGLGSSRVYVLNVAVDARRPELDRVIEPALLMRKTGYSRPHTVHCMPGGIIVISMLGDRDGDAPGGLAVLDAHTFDVLGRWEEDRGAQALMYDFWYQPRAGVMFSSEWAPPCVFEPGFKLEDVQAGLYGQRMHVWDLKERRVLQTVDLGGNGLVPLAVRGLHDPAADEGYVAAAQSSTLWHWHRSPDGFAFDQVVAVDSQPLAGWPLPVPGLITDQVISMDDRYLYFSNWFHGDIRQYDISDRAHPRLHSQVWAGGLFREVLHRGRRLSGGPQMLQLSLDGLRLYATNSLYSSWDNQFYPGLESWMLKIEIDPTDGRMRLDPDFLVDFGDGPSGPARAHEMRLPSGDPTTEIFQ